MNSLPWPAVILLVAIIASITVLGVTHIVSAEAIERVLSALIGASFGTVAGHILGSSVRKS